MIALVRSVTAAATASGSRLNVSGRMSTNTGVAPTRETLPADARGNRSAGAAAALHECKNTLVIGDGSSTVHMATGMSVYLIGFVLLAGFGCLPTVSQAILAGYAFGVPMGLSLALLGFGGASLIGYELVGRIARGRVEEELQRKPKAAMLRDALVHANPIQAFVLVSLLRASPSAPFALTNLLLGSLGVSRKIFFFGTIVGMLPRTLAAVLIGQQFTGWNGGIDKPRWMIIAGIIAVIVLVVLVSKIAAKALKRVADHTVHGNESPVVSV